MVPVVAAAPALEGVAVRTYWKARVVDAALVPREFCIPDESLLDKIARESKGTKRIPGVEFYADERLAKAR